MKKVRRIDDLLFTLMRITVIQCFLACLFLGVSLAHDGRGQSALSQKVTLNVENQDIKKILYQLEKQTNIKFVYSSKLIQSDRKATIKVQNGTLSRVLDELLTPLQLNYKASDDLIVIKPENSANQEPAKAESDLKKGQSASLRTVSGIVKDSTGVNLPGVNVVIKGTTKGTSTDAGGRYSIDVENENDILIFSYIGYVSQEIPAGTRTTLDVILKEEAAQLNDVIVVGYGTQKKTSITGSVAAITSDDLGRVRAGSTVSSALAGKIPGVSFRMADGRPGGTANINIRNLGRPLFVIDGVQQDLGQFNQIASNDIESITVLKDAAAAIYGVRAANGVVVVSTKKGKLNARNTINADVNFGFQSWTRYFEGLNDSHAYMSYRAEAEINRNGSTAITQSELDRYKAGTEYNYRSFNWRDFVIKRNAPMNTYNLNFTGGSDKITYYVSGTHLFQNSVLGREYQFQRTNVQSNITARIANGLKIGSSINGRIETNSNPGVPGGDDYEVALFSTIRNTPLERPYANDNPDYLNDIKHNETNWGYLNKNYAGKFRSDWRQIQINFDAEYQVAAVPGLSVYGIYSYYMADKLLNNHEYTYDTYTYNPENETYARTGGSINPWREREQVKEIKTTAQARLNYEKNFGQNTIAVILGTERLTENSLRNWIHSVPSANVQRLIYFETSDRYDDSEINRARAGYFARINYSYGNRYFLELSGRRDASYLFAPDKRVGYFPGGSVGWRITEEGFMKKLMPSNSILTDLKFRGSYGVLGDDRNPADANQPIVAEFAYLEGYRYREGTVILDGKPVLGSRDKGVPITGLSWLRSHMTNIGADFSLFNGQLTGSLEYFRRKRTGLPAARTDVLLPQEIGYTLPLENLNSDVRFGYDFALGYSGQKGEVKYNVSGNLSLSRGKNLQQYNPQFFNSVDQYFSSGINRYQGYVWGFEHIGQFQSQEEINNYPVNIDGQGNRTLLPGDLIYKDVDGDGKITDYDRRPIGYANDLPNVNMGFTLGINYKSFDFNADFSGATGYTVFMTEPNRVPFAYDGNLNTIFEDRWHRADIYDKNSAWIPGKYPALRFNDGNHSNTSRPSTFWAHDVTYFRARTIELGYSLPKELISRVKLQKARFYVNAYNLFSIDNMRKYNIDPEVSDGRGRQYPQSKIFNIGANLSF